jgi:glyoxylase-like metal-dependent hydrolase (beta-lactamase superfamily II)
MGRLAMHELDTRYLGIPRTASAFVVRGREGPVLVECGCAVAFEGLCAQLGELGLAPRELRGLFVTHVHLDHAGSAGHFAREGVPVFVHPRGARHLAEPSRLIAGSRAVHGARYGQFYGDPLPVPSTLLHAVEGGTSVALAGLRFEAIDCAVQPILSRTIRYCVLQPQEYRIEFSQFAPQLLNSLGGNVHFFHNPSLFLLLLSRTPCQVN